MIDRVIFDPRPRPKAGPAPRASRLGTLDGAVIATVDNGKTHAATLLQLIVDLLSERWSIAGVVHLGPPTPGQGGDPCVVHEAAKWATAAIAGIGDCGSCSSGTVLDAILFERIGIPAVPIVTRPFLPTAMAIAGSHRFDGEAVVVVDHPITTLDHAALAQRAAAAAPLVAAALLRRSDLTPAGSDPSRRSGSVPGRRPDGPDPPSR